VRALLAVAIVVAGSPAHAELARPIVAPMTAVEGNVCALLRAESGERCTRIATLGGAAVYQSGSRRGIRRLVMAIDRDEDKLVGPSVDLPGEDCAGGRCVTLVATSASVRAIAIDGRPGVAADIVATFRAGVREPTWQTEAIVGCARGDNGAWRCATFDAGRCAVTLADDGAIATSCGGRALLTLR